MTNAPISQASLRGAVDLSSLVNPRPAQQTAAPTGSAVVRSATDASFSQVLELSNTVPVIVEFFGQGVASTLGPLIEEYAGKLVLVTVDAPLNPQLVQAFQVTSAPTVAAVVAGRPIQLFVGEYPVEEIRQVLDQVLDLGRQQNVTGSVPVGDPTEAPELVEEPLPPHHQEAYDAITNGDFATAIAEYKTAIAQNPRDALAIAGLAQVSLLQRLDGVEAAALRAAAAADPSAVDAALAVADLDTSGGHVEDAFGRLLDLFPAADAPGKTAIRTRLLDYFEIVGGDDPRVIAARRRLTGLLY